MDAIKVFISSAMNTEMDGSIEWLSVRSRIASTIRENALFGPFAIEEHASPDRSNQYMLSKVSECDIYILLLGSELRYGTAQEYRKAHELKKSMLVYVLDTTHDAECEACLKELRQEDYCLYRKIQTVKGLEHKVMDDLIEHVARRYKGLPQSSRLVTSFQYHPDRSISHDSVLRHYGKSSLLLGEQFGYEYDTNAPALRDSSLEPLGESLVDWLLTGAPPSIRTNRDALSKAFQEDGMASEDIELLRLRWDACDNYLSGNVDSAIAILEGALSKAEDHTHVLTSILIDLRNLASERGDYGASSEYQDQIGVRGVDSYLPIGAAFASRIESTMQKAQDAEWLISERTRVFGERRLASILLNMSNVLFAAVSYGSIASTLSCRVELAKILMRFSRLYADSSLYVEGLRLLILACSSGELEEWLQAGYDYSVQELVAQAGKLWDTAFGQAKRAVDDCGCVIFAELGEYFDDKRFHQASLALLERAHDTRAFNGHKYCRALASNAHRMNPGFVINMLCLLLQNHSYTTNVFLQDCLVSLRIKDASREDQMLLASTLKSSYPRLAEEGFSASIIAILARECDAFVQLGSYVKSQLSAEKLVEYELNEQQRPISSEYCLGLIDESLKQLVANDNPGAQSMFSTKPARYLAEIVTTENYGELRQSVEPRLVELMKQVSSSGAPGAVLDDYVLLATRMALVYSKTGLSTPRYFGTLARLLAKKRPPIDPLLSSYERSAWNIRVATYRLICGAGTKKDFLWAISDIMGSSVGTREACAESLEIYLDYKQGKTFHDMATIASCLHMLSRDKDVDVRLIAERCAMRLIGTPIDHEARVMLHRFTSDARPEVRYGLLTNGQRLLKDSGLLQEITEYLRDDAHYEIRRKATGLYEDISGEG